MVIIFNLLLWEDVDIMIKYDVIEIKEKFEPDKIACIYNVRYFYDEDGPSVGLIYDKPIHNDVFLKFYLVNGNLIDNNILNGFNESEKVIVLLKEDLEKIYTDEEDGYILSDDFENLVYECDFDLELNEKIKDIGEKIIRKTYFGFPGYSRSIRLGDNKMIISSNYLCFVNLLNSDNINLENCDKLDKEDILKIVCSLILKYNFGVLLEEVSDNIKEFLIIIENKYGKINNIYEVKKEYIEEVNDMELARTLIMETEKVNIAINIGFYD
jgi:hypothetical protein